MDLLLYLDEFNRRQLEVHEFQELTLPLEELNHLNLLFELLKTFQEKLLILSLLQAEKPRFLLRALPEYVQSHTVQRLDDQFLLRVPHFLIDSPFAALETFVVQFFLTVEMAREFELLIIID